MFCLPRVIRDETNVLDWSVIRVNATGDHGNRQPLQAVRGLDLVAVSPAVLVVLDAVVEDEDVGFLNLMKVAAPRYVTRLKNDTIHNILGLLPVRNSSASRLMRRTSKRRPASWNSPRRIPTGRPALG